MGIGDASEKKLILAVVGCQEKIAHTDMAAEALEKQALEMGCEIKVEARGTDGVKNVLPQEEIGRALGIIVAADTEVPMERFDGKRVVQSKMEDGVHEARELIGKALASGTPVYHAMPGDGQVGGGPGRGTDGRSLCRYLAPFGLGVLFGLGIYSLGKYVMLLFG